MMLTEYINNLLLTHILNTCLLPHFLSLYISRSVHVYGSQFTVSGYIPVSLLYLFTYLFFYMHSIELIFFSVSHLFFTHT